MPPVPTSARARSGTSSPRLSGWFAVIAVTVGIFSVVTAEILPIGLLTPIGTTFGISAGTAGLTMTVPGLVAAVAAPTTTAATAAVDRRLVLCALMVVLAAADFLAAVAPAYWVLVVSRVLVGVVIGAFWSVGAGLAARLVPERHAGHATAVIFAAVPLGSVLGVPAGTYLATPAGWRAAFVVMGLLTLGVVAALVAFLPALPPQTPTRLSVLRTVLRGTGVRVGMLVTFLVVVAHFGTYTYVTPFLADVTRATPGSITTYLLVFGSAGLVGNSAAGLTVTRAPGSTFGVAAAMLAAATLLLPVFGHTHLGALVLLVVWGLAYGAVPVCSQTWIVTAAPHVPEAATVLFTSTFQVTIALGALAGGVVVDVASTPAVMVAGGLVALLVPLVIGVFRPPARP